MDVFKSLFKLFFGRKRKKKYLPPDTMPKEAMAKVMDEVNFLRSRHSVDVRELEPNEIPSIPKRAD